MHNKFSSIERIIVYTRSFNQTNSATIRHDDNYVITKDEDVVEIYENQFQKIWEENK